MELFRLLGTIAIDADQARQTLEDTARQANDTSDETEGAFGRIAAAAGGFVKSFALTGAAIAGAWLVAIEGSREYRTEMGKLDTAFQASGHSSEAAKKTYSDLNAVLGDTGQATEAAQILALLADNEKELQEWTDICTGVYARLGEAVPIEELAASANETAKSGVLTGGLVDALVQAGHSEEEFQAKLDLCTNEQQRQDLIMTTLNGTYKKASDQYKETNKDILDANRAQEKLTGAFAELGRIGEPILTAIKTKVAEMVTAAVPHLESLIGKFRDARTWVQNNKTTIDAWAAVIIGATVSIGAFLLILNWGAIMTAAANGVRAVRTAILAMNAAMVANPIGLVVALIAGLVAAFAYLWKNNEGFRKFWLDMWNKIKSATSTAVSWISGKLDSLSSAIGKAKSKFSEIQKTISDKMTAAQNAVKKAVDKIKGFFNFKWSLPKLKMPSIGIKGKFSIDPPSVPKFSIKWNAEGGILTRATIFGMSGGQFLGGGEAGHEAIAPISVLQEYVQAAVRAENGTLVEVLIEQNRKLMDFLSRIIPSGVRLDSGALVGALTPAIDGQLADRWRHSLRGNTR